MKTGQKKVMLEVREATTGEEMAFARIAPRCDFVNCDLHDMLFGSFDCVSDARQRALLAFGKDGVGIGEIFFSLESDGIRGAFARVLSLRSDPLSKLDDAGRQDSLGIREALLCGLAYHLSSKNPSAQRIAATVWKAGDLPAFKAAGFRVERETRKPFRHQGSYFSVSRDI